MTLNRFVHKVLSFTIYSISVQYRKFIAQSTKLYQRITFPYRFNRIYKRRLGANIDYNSSIDLISGLWTDKGALCSSAFDPIIKNDGTLTIIIPVYNVESYIAECLDSILRQQTKFDYSIQIVDDGSSDETLSIVEKYAERHNNIKVLSQKNSSQAVARNNALNICSSEWVMMVDGDDILTPDSLQSLMDIAINNKCDVVEGAVQPFLGDVEGTKFLSKNESLKISEATIGQKYILSSRGYSCGKLYHRNLWNNVRYPERYIFEDIITKYVVCRKAKRYAKTSRIVYGYRHRSDSSSHSNVDFRKMDCLWVMDKVQAIREANNIKIDSINHILLINHYGMLAALLVSNMERIYQEATITIARESLIKWGVTRDSLPYFFRKSFDAIMNKNVDAWLFAYRIISKYNFITNFREID